jgi:hypothetical protein|nr:MAG TPA: hypothetical protein [Caudoviricetes sp.]
MFEFFIALFGGSFLGAKLHSEKKQLKEFDKKQAVIKDAYDSGVQAWEASVVDRNLEDELTERLNSDIEFKQAAIQEMQEELGDDIPETLGYPTPRSAVLRYLLAKKGKLLSADASQFGIRVVAPQPHDSKDKARWKQEVKFVRWMGSKIKDFVPDATLMFKSAGGFDSKPLSANAISDYDGGDFFWDVSSYVTYGSKFEPTQEQKEKEASLSNACGIFAGILILIFAFVIAVLAIKSI